MHAFLYTYICLQKLRPNYRCIILLRCMYVGTYICSICTKKPDMYTTLVHYKASFPMHTELSAAAFGQKMALTEH